MRANTQSDLVAGLLVAAVLVAAGCDGEGSARGVADAARVEVARLGDLTIRGDELEAILRLLRPEHPGKYRTTEQLESLAREVVSMRALARKARQSGVADRVDVRYRIDGLLRDELVRAEVDSKVRFVDITDDQVAQYYADHESDYRMAETISVHEIVVPPSSESIAAEIAERAQRGDRTVTEFLHLSKSYPAVRVDARGSLTFVGEEINGQPIDDVERAVLAAARGLETIGAVAGPIRTSAGFHVVRLSGRRPETVRSLASVREEIRYDLYKALRARALDDLLAGVAPDAAASVDRDALEPLISRPIAGETSARGHPPTPPVPGLPKSFGVPE